MVYTRFGSMRDIEQVVEQIGEQIGNFIHQVSKEAPFTTQQQRRHQPHEQREQHIAAPRLDVEEDDANVYITAELPGLEKSDIAITVNDERVLTIRGEKKRTGREGARRISNERLFGQFARSVVLPDQVDPSQVRASYNNGLLTITVGKVVPQSNEINVEIH